MLKQKLGASRPISVSDDFALVLADGRLRMLPVCQPVAGTKAMSKSFLL
jgi:hypothetical protein